MAAARPTNADIAQELYALADLAGKNSHKWIAYNAAAKAITNADIDVALLAASGGSKPSIKRVGDKIWNIIVQFCRTGRSDMRTELERAAAARSVFTKIIGVGEVTADEWIHNGITTIYQLRTEIEAGRIRLTHAQVLGLRYYDDLQIRVPRAEVSHITSLITSMLPPTPSKGPTIVGSWRRGLATSGDVDILVAYDTINNQVNQIATAVGPALTLSSRTSRISFLIKSWVYMRQVDILIIPTSEWGAALLYFTGSWEFNESMRRYAKGKGLRLNQMGLYAIDGGKQRLIASKTEEEIFAALGLEYVEPQNRTGNLY